MDTYFEQTVTAPPRAGTKAAMAAAWLLLIVLGIAAVVCLTSTVSVTEESGLKFNVYALIGLAASVALGVLVYRSKDRLNTEYDYIISGDTLEVCGIYAEKRRKKLLTVDLREISAFGSVNDNSYRAENARPGIKKRSYVLNEDASASYICFRKENERILATLELNDELRQCVEQAVLGQYGLTGGRY